MVTAKQEAQIETTEQLQDNWGFIQSNSKNLSEIIMGRRQQKEELNGRSKVLGTVFLPLCNLVCCKEDKEPQRIMALKLSCLRSSYNTTGTK